MTVYVGGTKRLDLRTTGVDIVDLCLLQRVTPTNVKQTFMERNLLLG